MLERQSFPIDQIYLPTDKRKGLDAGRVEALAEAIMEEGQKTPIRVRQGKDRFVLIEGAHRLEALKALGETEITGFLVKGRVK